MKKLLSILAIAGVMAACNSGKEEASNVDSSNMASAMAPAQDTVGMSHDTTTMHDTSKMEKK